MRRSGESSISSITVVTRHLCPLSVWVREPRQYILLNPAILSAFTRQQQSFLAQARKMTTTLWRRGLRSVRLSIRHLPDEQGSDRSHHKDCE